MSPWLALAGVVLACWSAWLELAARVKGLDALLPLVLVIGALAVKPLTSPRRPIPLTPLMLLLGAHIVAVLFAPPIFRIAPATLAVCWFLHAGTESRAPRASFYGLVLLALPVMPTLEFYLAYPVRLAAIEASASLLRMNGVAVGVEGLALRFGGELVQFDAPCSGVRMLWTCAFLASALAHLYRFPWWRYGLALGVATLFAVAGNVIRATSLFYMEAGLFVNLPPWLHGAVGIAAFAMTAMLLLLALRPRAPARFA